MKTSHPISCRCGAFRAEVAHPDRATRAVCYCRDCQAFARYLGLPDGMLDPAGGTDIVAARPRLVSFTQGTENLTCMSLSEGGLLRWYTSCCKTPIGNTPRDIRLSHVGLIHNCLEMGATPLEESFGRVKMRVNIHGATGTPVKGSRIGSALALSRYMASLTWYRVSGRYRENPFFDTTTGLPRVSPHVLSPAERAAVYSAH